MRLRYELAGTEERVLGPLPSAVYLKTIAKVHGNIVLYTWDCRNRNWAKLLGTAILFRRRGKRSIVYSSVTAGLGFPKVM